MTETSDSVATQASALIGAATIAGGSTGWLLSVGRLLASGGDQNVALYDTPGQAPEVKYLVDYPTFQIIVRGAIDDYAGAFRKAKQCKDLFLGMDPYTFSPSGDRWDGVTMLGDLAFLKYDDNSRPLWTGNYRVIVERATSTLSSRSTL